MEGSGLETSGPGQGKVVGTCKHGNEPSEERLYSVGLVKLVILGPHQKN